MEMLSADLLNPLDILMRNNGKETDFFLLIYRSVHETFLN